MEQYEIIVQKAKASTLALLFEEHSSDKEAIRSARKIALGRQFEVWRGAECVTGFMKPLPPLG